MVIKRAIAMILGAAAGVVLWFAFDAVRAGEEQSDPNSQGCVGDELIICVGYEAPVESLRPAPTSQLCKAWLSNSSSSSIAMLSQCLRGARQAGDAERLQQIKRARAIGTSS